MRVGSRSRDLITLVNQISLVDQIQLIALTDCLIDALFGWPAPKGKQRWAKNRKAFGHGFFTIDFVFQIYLIGLISLVDHIDQMSLIDNTRFNKPNRPKARAVP